MNKLFKTLLFVMAAMSSQLLLSHTAVASDNNDEIEIYLTRHGQTLFNVDFRFQGWADSPLTEPGEEIARRLGKGLKEKGLSFDRAYTSDSGRAIQTAELVLENSGQGELPIKHLKSLREWYFGSFEGADGNQELPGIIEKAGIKSVEQMFNDISWQEYANAFAIADPKGRAENWQQISTRLMQGMDEVVKDAKAHNAKKVFIVTHGYGINTIVENIQPNTVPTDKNVNKNCSVTTVVYKNGKYSLKDFNNLSYIQ